MAAIELNFKPGNENYCYCRFPLHCLSVLTDSPRLDKSHYYWAAWLKKLAVSSRKLGQGLPPLQGCDETWSVDSYCLAVADFSSNVVSRSTHSARLLTLHLDIIPTSHGSTVPGHYLLQKTCGLNSCKESADFVFFQWPV